MHNDAPRVVTVRGGAVRPTGSWLYVWVDAADGSVAYVGATGFDPELRAFLHLTSDDPEVGRVRSSVSRAAERDFDVLCFAVPPGVSRANAKRALLARLAEPGILDGPGPGGGDEDPLSSVVEPIVAALRDHVRHLADAE